MTPPVERALLLSGMAASLIVVSALFVRAGKEPPRAEQGGNMQLTIGQTAPSFRFKTPEGETKSLADYRGKTVIVYFYPKDETPGCIKEACSFRDNLAEFGKRDAVVLGVSADDAASHEAFRNHYKLPFTLVPDPGGSIARSYGVFDESRGLAMRQTFVVDPEGRIEKVFRDVKADGHAGEVLDSIGAHAGR
jgi:thioredoxin-dependent peroxiredoxin